MELDQYLEQDIILFLDSKIVRKEKTAIDREEDYGLYLTKDYLKDISYALDNDELTKAKRLFDELKGEYGSLPESSFERKRIYAILQKMYEKIKDYAQIRVGNIEVIAHGDSKVLIEKRSSPQDPGLGENSTSKDSSRLLESPGLKVDEEDLGFDLMRRGNDTIRTGKGEQPAQVPSPAKVGFVEDNLVKQVIASSKGENIRKYYEDGPETTEKLPDDAILSQNIFPEHASANSIIIQGSLDTAHSQSVIRPGTREVAGLDVVHIDKPLVLEKLTKKDIALLKRQIIEQLDLRSLKDEIIDKIVSRVDELKQGMGTDIYSRVSKEMQARQDEYFEKTSRMIDSRYNQLLQAVSSEIELALKRPDAPDANDVVLGEKKSADKVQDRATDVLDIRPPSTGALPDDIVGKSVVLTQEAKKELYSLSADLERGMIRTGSILLKKSVDGDHVANFLSNDIQVIYEQAVYDMSEKKYDNAARLLRKIIDVQPNNKAAQIRLEECASLDPRVAKSKDVASEDQIKSLKAQSREFSSRNASSAGQDKGYDIKKFKSDIDKDLASISKRMHARHAKGTIQARDKIVSRLYSEAMHAMAIERYQDAVTILDEILRIDPNNKAAKIRLEECADPSWNAVVLIKEVGQNA